MSKQGTEVDLSEIFNIFDDPERDQYFLIKDVIKTKGISLFFNVLDYNPMIGLFGEQILNDNFSCEGIKNLLQKTEFIQFPTLDSSENPSLNTLTFRGVLNKVKFFYDDVVEVSVMNKKGEIILKKECLIFHINEPIKELFKSKSFLLSVIEDSGFQLKIRLVKEDQERASFEQKHFSNEIDFFDAIIGPRIFSIMNDIKCPIKKGISDFIFNEKVSHYVLSKENGKTELLRKAYIGKKDFIYLQVYLETVKNNKIKHSLLLPESSSTALRIEDPEEFWELFEKNLNKIENDIKTFNENISSGITFSVVFND